MRHTFLLNPAARGGRAARLAPLLPAWAEAAGVDACFATAATPDEAADRAQAAAEAGHAVVAVGGDGTIHAVVRGLRAASREAPLGIVPCGTGDDFAKMTGTPRRARAAVAALAGASVRRFDVGVVRWSGPDGAGERTFVNAIGAGFDGAVAAGVARHKHLPGAAAYLAAVVAALRERCAPAVRVEADGAVVHDGPLLLACVANGRSSGGRFLLTPGAAADDGALDVCAIRSGSLVRLLPLLPRVLAGRHAGAEGVRTARAATVELAAAAPLPLHADGEVLALHARSVRATVVPRALPVLVPCGARAAGRRAR